VRWHYSFYPTTLLEHAIAATLIVFAVESWRERHRIEWRSPLTYPTLLFLSASAISVVMAPNKVAALGLFRAYMVEPIAMALVLLNSATTARRALVVFSGLAVAGLALAIPNAIVVLEALRTNTYDVLQTPPVVIYTTANAVALFLGPLIAIAASLVLHGSTRTIRIGSAAFLVGAAPSMLLTFSRGGYLAMAAVAVGLALSHRLRVWLVAGTVAAGVLVALIPPIFTRISVEFQNVGGTTFFGRAGRLELWSATLQMLRQHPIFGAGLSGFAERIAPFWNERHPERFIDPHNIILNFWVETGILGVVAFAWLLAVALRVAWRGWKDAGPDWRPIFLGILLALVAILVHGLVDVPYFKNDLSLEFWVIAGVLVAGHRSWKANLEAQRTGVPGTSTGTLR
jgi:putative inorganic carbon (HCO3(-)) transporter